MAAVGPTRWADDRSLRDRIEIEDVICTQTLYTDLMEWDKVLASYTDDAAIHYAATFGAGFDGVSPREFYDHVRSLLPGFDCTQHQLTNFEVIVDGDTASVRCHGRATHILGAQAWVSASIYVYEMLRTPAGWRIRRKGRIALFQENREELMEKAKERVRQGWCRPQPESPLQASASRRALISGARTGPEP